MRKRITYANVAATLALVLSMSGGAMAATHYLINSTKQIDPKVLRSSKARPVRQACRARSDRLALLARPAPRALPAKKAKKDPKARPGR